jgi:aminopeptidase N
MALDTVVENKQVFRSDYQQPAYWVDTVELSFDLDADKTRVLNRMTLRRNAAVPDATLRLDGEEIDLSRVLVNGQASSFKVERDQLVLDNLPQDGSFSLEVFTICRPAKNTKLMGLFVSNGTLFTQCEAEGFRRITYFLDRPDVMATYTVLLRADKANFPVLLSNGNLLDSGDLDGGRHFAKWHDPFKKPSYLFALVAGQLVCREQVVTTQAGREHLLQVYVRPGDLDKTEHALQSLVASIAWDEHRFGLPLDLDRFMIVATSDFNMGAMENKGLNIFNTKFVLANPQTASDVDYGNVLSVVGHEYFHNWTGNRVTCRDWFQLSLKEGLTVFRDQEFTQDLCQDASARAVKRIEDVRVLRSAQFSEDAGPMAHPVRPDSYQEISNFYTMTIYEKGAEVVRMMQTLVGREGFAKGMSLYFERFDGMAVTCDDFAQAIADANPGSALAQHLPQFKLWYSQAGTPKVAATGHYDAVARTYTLELTQSAQPSPGQTEKLPMVIPVLLGLVGADGSALPLQLNGQDVGMETLAVLTETHTTLQFTDMAAEPLPSLLRGFSAPVILEMDYPTSALVSLLQHDLDPFNRWEAAQRLALSILLPAINGTHNNEQTSALTEQYTTAMGHVLRDPKLDPAFKDLVLTLPSHAYIAERLTVVNPQTVHQAREALKLALAQGLAQDWENTYATHRDVGSYHLDERSMGRRALTGLSLNYLCLLGNKGSEQALQHLMDANNLTDRVSALSALVACGSELAPAALAHFYELGQHDALVTDKWFSIQASAPDRKGSTLQAVRQLMHHKDFSLQNPNRARSLIFAFCTGNPSAFHQLDASGYVFWAEQVLALDAINPQVAARLGRALDRWKNLAEPFSSAAKVALERVASKADLSKDLSEVIAKALAA